LAYTRATMTVPMGSKDVSLSRSLKAVSVLIVF